jgi:CRISPR-associated protein Cas2
VRDELWNRAVKKSKESGSILQIWTDQTPQGFSYRQCGKRERTFVDLEGISLIKIERSNRSNPDKNSDTRSI